jgi:peptide subunit release factor RF-3
MVVKSAGLPMVRFTNRLDNCHTYPLELEHNLKERIRK